MANTSLQMPPNYQALKPTYRMLIKTSDGKITFGAYFAPREVEYGGFGRTWSEVARSGRTPMLVHESNKLRTMSFTMMLGHATNPDFSFQTHLDNLRKMAESGTPVKIIYGGGFDNLTWRLTDLSIKSLMRHPVKSYITRAEISFQFTVVSDIKVASGPVTGGVKKTTSNSTAKKKSTAVSQATRSSKKVRYYTIKKGDTLYALAIKWYGDSSRWRELADKNKIKDVRKIAVGTKIKY